MRRRALNSVTLLLLPVLLLSLAMAMTAVAAEPEEGPFAARWSRTDAPVASGDTSRTWMWGPDALGAGFYEQYQEAEQEQRFVQYFDKARMEISHLPDANPESVWYVTTGLLAKELITGDMQIGDTQFEDRAPADVAIAGDLSDFDSPTYATFSMLLGAAPHDDGALLITRVDPAGVTWADDELASHAVTAAHRVEVEGIDHQVASPFWTFMNSQGIVLEDGTLVEAALFMDPFYATGYPITEAYWANIDVGGQKRDVLMQCFERRCLTFNPDNPVEWQVEAGNIGLHYHMWRYEHAPDETPAIGDVHYEWNVMDWAEVDDSEWSSVTRADDELRISLFSGFVDRYGLFVEGMEPEPLSHSAISVDIRSLAPETVGFGCLVPRHYIEGTRADVYLFCLDDLGGLTYWYESFDYETGDYSSDLLMTFRSSQAANPVGEWNTLTIVLAGSEMWLIINGDLIGTVSDDHIPLGNVSLYGLSFDESEPPSELTYSFRNLTISTLD